jgi:hypothetical protein
VTHRFRCTAKRRQRHPIIATGARRHMAVTCEPICVTRAELPFPLRPGARLWAHRVWHESAPSGEARRGMAPMRSSTSSSTTRMRPWAGEGITQATSTYHYRSKCNSRGQGPKGQRALLARFIQTSRQYRRTAGRAIRHTVRNACGQRWRVGTLVARASAGDMVVASPSIPVKTWGHPRHIQNRLDGNLTELHLLIVGQATR